MQKKILILLVSMLLTACTKKPIPVEDKKPETKEETSVLTLSQDKFLNEKTYTVFDVELENKTIDSFSSENEYFYTVNVLEQANSSSYVTNEVYSVKLDGGSNDLQLELIYTLDEAARVFEIKRFDGEVYISLIENRSDNKLSKHKVVRLNETGYEVLYEVMVDWCYDTPSYYILNNKLFLTSLSVNTDDDRYLQEFKLLVLQDNQFVTLETNTCDGENYSDCFQYQGQSSAYPEGFSIVQSYMKDAQKKVIWEVNQDEKISKKELDDEIFSFGYVSELGVYISSSTNGISLWDNSLDLNSSRSILNTKEMFYPMTIDGSDIYGTLGDSYNSITKMDLKNMTVSKQTIKASIPETVWAKLIIIDNKVFVSLNNDAKIEIIEFDKESLSEGNQRIIFLDTGV